MNVHMSVVYTGGTVDALRHFVPPLIAHTPWTFCLVSNGCSARERDVLACLAETSSRLSLEDLGSDTIVPLGEALSGLLSREIPGADHVGFLDSDVLITADIADGFATVLQTNDAVFSAPPIWMDHESTTLDADRREVSGPYRITPDGLPMGSSYMAIYRQRALREVMAGCAVTADKYVDITSLDAAFQCFLHDHDLAERIFDPTKLLNLAFTFQGRPVAFHEPDSIVHIGGYSHTIFARALAGHAENEPPSTHSRQADILGYQDFRPYMDLKRAVTTRLSTSFACLTRGETVAPTPRFPEHLERRVALVEAHWQQCLHDQNHDGKRS